MDNRQDNPATELTDGSPINSPKRKKPTKLDAEAFVASWRVVLSSEKDPVIKLRQMIKAGFVGEINGERVSQTVSSLLEAQAYPCLAERLALSLALQERFGRLRPLAHRVLEELRTSFRGAIDYDPQEFSSYRGPRGIEEWVAEHAIKAPPSERDAWLRRFVICLLKDTESKTLFTGLFAAARILLPAKKPASSEAVFMRGLVASLSSPVISTSRLQLILASAISVEAQFQEMLNHGIGLERQIRTQKDSIEKLGDQVAKLEAELAEARNDGEKKAVRITELERSIQDASERHALLDRHWRGVSEQQLAKQSGSFREKVKHELQEALLALDRQEPNIDMALQRLRRIGEILEK